MGEAGVVVAVPFCLGPYPSAVGRGMPVLYRGRDNIDLTHRVVVGPPSGFGDI